MATVPTYEQRVMPAPAPGMEATARLQGPLGYGAGLEAFGKDVQQGAEDVQQGVVKYLEQNNDYKKVIGCC